MDGVWSYFDIEKMLLEDNRHSELIKNKAGFNPADDKKSL